ncbi:MAG TPA: ABC transporter substrate binding protein [Rhodocyclaceae bacterium]|nr:ABC transporter substrate binding protein [Rhodocyclaceae bacterium]
MAVIGKIVEASMRGIARLVGIGLFLGVFCVGNAWAATAGASRPIPPARASIAIDDSTWIEPYRLIALGDVFSILETGDAGVGFSAFRAAGETILLAELSEQLNRQGSVGADSIAVLYPELGEPFRSIFAKIIEGIEGQLKIQVRSYAVGAAVNVADLNAQLKRSGTRVVIALGRQGLKTATALDKEIAVVAGAVLAMPEADSRPLSGISLSPDPSLMFARLKTLLPGVKRVIVVYDPKSNEWLIKLAREAAKAQGLELTTQEARDLATAARLYEAAFAGADARRDAVWLPQDATTVDDATILPLVLKESWNRSVPVFSSNFMHVKRGVLFALYPNNLEMGRTLANYALGALGGDSARRGVTPLRELHAAVNLRTANHIGVKIDDRQQSAYEFVVPGN